MKKVTHFGSATVYLQQELHRAGHLKASEGKSPASYGVFGERQYFVCLFMKKKIMCFFFSPYEITSFVRNTLPVLCAVPSVTPSYTPRHMTPSRKQIQCGLVDRIRRPDVFQIVSIYVTECTNVLNVKAAKYLYL